MNPNPSARTFVPLAAVLAAAVLASAPDAHAFRMMQVSTGRTTSHVPVTCNDAGGFAHWKDASTSWRHNLALQGAGKADALRAAMATWAAVPGAAHHPNYSGTTGAGFATDGLNTFVWATGNGCVGTCLALTALVVQAGQVIVESDVTFNDQFSFQTDGNDIDTQAVATHELGHALGIAHSDLAAATMAPTYIGTDGRSLEPDDEAALQCSQSRFPPKPVVQMTSPTNPIDTVPGVSLTIPLLILRGPGFASDLDLQVLNVPSGVGVSFSTDPATTATPIVELSLTVGPTVAFGSHSLTVRAQGDGETALRTVTLAVKRLVVGIDEGGFTVFAGEPAEVSGVTLLRAPGFTETVTLTVEGIPPGQHVTATPVPATVAGTATTSTLRVVAGRFAPGGDYVATLKATAASASDSQSFAIEVVPLAGLP